METLSPSLSVLSAMITPAVLISACGTLILSTSQRLGRVIERVQTWSDRLTTAVALADGAPARDEIELIFAQLRDSTRRARLLQLGLTTFYLAVGVFVADMVVIGFMSLGHHTEIWPTVGLGLLGAVLLLVGCMVLIAESRIAMATTFREMEFVRARGEARVPSEIRRRRGLLSRFRRSVPRDTSDPPTARSR